MHELGLDTTNNNGSTGSTPLNPHNPDYYTGGSSGGSAYAVSTGLLPIALGADGGGSIRMYVMRVHYFSSSRSLQVPYDTSQVLLFNAYPRAGMLTCNITQTLIVLWDLWSQTEP